MLSVSFVLVALIKRGGGKRPDEARQPACSNAGRVPIPAEHSPFVLPCRSDHVLDLPAPRQDYSALYLVVAR